MEETRRIRVAYAAQFFNCYLNRAKCRIASSLWELCARCANACLNSSALLSPYGFPPRIGTSIRARHGVAHPSLLGKPFMLGPTNRAVDPCEKDRHGLEALAIRSQTGGDVPSGLRASHHDGSHWPLLAFVVAPLD